MSVIKHKFIILFLFIFTSFASAEISQTKQLNKLFNKLSKSHNVNTANLVEQEIWAVWHKHPKNINLTDKLELGTELMYQGDYKYALQIFTNIIKTDPSWSEAWNKRATLLFFMKEYQRSLDDIDKVLAIEPRHFGALAGRAQIFIELEEYQKAIKDLKRAKKIHPIIISNNLITTLEKLVKDLSI
jgi:tetratricopeptide (TPR) repeat protein